MKLSIARLNDGGVAIGLGIFVAILMILLTVSLVAHIYCFTKYETNNH